MKNFFDKIFKDKRILVIYLLVIILIVAGVTYALNISSLNLAGTTAVIGIDEDAYGETSIDTSGIKLRSILDNKVETSLDNVIKIDFVVGGNQNNTTDEVIYDIALVDLEMDDELSSQYVKWKLVKNDKEVIFYDDFSDVSSGDRVVLTTTQQDLVPYSENKSSYDSYTFYLWLSDSCQKNIGSCTNVIDQSDLLNKHISGKIEVELYTGSKNGQGSANVIIEPVYGDVNNDGSVNTFDRTFLSKYLSGMEGYDLDNQGRINADVNVDNVVNDVDYVILTNYLAKWDEFKNLPYMGTAVICEPEKFTVVYGDVNNDGKVNMIDGMFFSRYFDGWEEYDLDCQARVNADVNTDGFIDEKDLDILSKHLGKNSGYETLPYVG